jgi:hypothetical protein
MGEAQAGIVPIWIRKLHKPSLVLEAALKYLPFAHADSPRLPPDKDAITFAKY